MRPGDAAVCPGEVFHRRHAPTTHSFRYPVSYVWLDPDCPKDLCRPHPLWSASHPAPARFRAGDYGDGSEMSLAEVVRNELTLVIGRRPTGEIRMLTQVRRWGWLFNPITLFVVWDADPDNPICAVLEVTNTPWKQRLRYPIALSTETDREGIRCYAGRVAKALHVSPFLDESHEYLIRLRDRGAGSFSVSIDVIPHGANEPTLVTELRVERRPVTRSALSRALFSEFAPTHRVSFGIHAQAVRLWLKRVPFVPHPSKRRQRRFPS